MSSICVQNSPEPWEPGENFKFIAQTINVLDKNSRTLQDSKNKVNLVATAGKYGFVFISDQRCIKVFQTNSLTESSNSGPLPLKIIDGRGTITYLATSCNSQTLLVVTIIKDIPFGLFYDVSSLVANSSASTPFYFAPLSTHMGSSVSSVAWNPCDGSCVVIALCNGDLILIKIKETSVEFNTQKSIGASAVTWSAKGKQLAVGRSDGSVALYKPDLTPVRVIEKPPQKPEIGAVISLNWFTNTEFFIGYLCNNVTPTLLYVNAPKGKQAVYFNFDDVCYSTENKQKQVNYYTHFFNEWNVLLVLSSHAIEMGVVGKNVPSPTGDCQWCQWFPDDDARASMHFVNVTEETFPLGLAVDFTAAKTWLAKDESTRGPFPVAFSLSTGGELNAFFVENKVGGATSNLFVANEKLPTSGIRTSQQFGLNLQNLPQEPQPQPQQQPVLNLERSSSSAFSSVPGKPFAFSTPIKSTSSEGSMSLIGKPVSLSNQVGADRNTVLHVPSPKKSLNPPLGSPHPPSSPRIQQPPAYSFKPQGIPPQSLSQATGAFQVQPQSSSLFKSQPQPTLPFQTPPQPNLPFQTPPQPTLIQPQPMAAVKTQPSPVPTKPAVTPFQSQAKTSSPTIKAVVHKPTTPKVSNSQLLKIATEEVTRFEEEMKRLRISNNNIKFQIGAKEEESAEASRLSAIEKWMKEMQKTTSEQSEEVAALHKNTFEALASYEDANAHKKYNSRNEMYLRLRPLDPYSQRRLEEIRSKHQYLLSQLGEVNTKLDLQWEELCCSKKNYRKEQDSTKNLYRSVLNLHTARVTLEKQLDSICQKFKNLSCSFILDYQTEDGKDNSAIKEVYSPKKSSKLAQILAQRSITPIRKQLASPSLRRTGGVSAEQGESFLSPSTPPVETEAVLSSPMYEQISPPDSPIKSGTGVPSSNPLGALSSLVGKVADTKGSVGGATHSLFTAKPSATSSPLTPTNIAQVPPTFNFSPKPPPIDSTASSFAPAVSTATSVASSGIAFSGTSFNFTSVVTNPKSPTVIDTAKPPKSTPDVKPPESQLASLLAKGPSSGEPLPSLSSLNFASILGKASASAAPKSPAFPFSPTLTTVSPPSPASQPALSLPNFSSLLGNASGSSLFATKSVASSTPVTIDAVLPSTPDASPQKTIAMSSAFSATPVSGVTHSSAAKSLFGPSSSPLNLSSSASSTESQSTKFSTPLNASPFISVSVSTGTATSGQPTTSSLFSPSVSVKSSLFSQVSTTSSSSLFSGTAFSSNSASYQSATITPVQSSTVSPISIPSISSQSSSLFGGQITTSTQSTSLFTKPTTQGSTLFGGQIPTSTQNSSLFGGLTTVTSQGPTLFGGQTTVTSQGPSLFGGQTTVTSQSSSLFAGQTAATSQSSSLFGGQTTVTSQSSPLFGGQTTVTSQSSSLFGGQTTITPQSSSLFGGQTTITPQSSSLFGGQTAVTSQSAPLFGGQTAVSSQSAFSVSNLAVSAAKSGGIFGGQSVATTQVPSLFGQTAVSSQSVFGDSSTQPISAFGSSAISPSTTSSSDSVFGANPVNSPFAQQQSSMSSAFAQPANFGSASTPSVFGGGSNVTVTSSGSIFGGNAATTGSTFAAEASSAFGVGSLFGKPPSSTSIFGEGNVATTATVTSNQQSIFSSGFGQQSSNPSSLFTSGGVFSGLGKIPDPENASKNIFGSSAVSGNPTGASQPNLFGGVSNVPFGSKPNEPAVPQQVGAFSPVRSAFGPSPAFGGAATFGGSASFGTSPPSGSIFGGGGGNSGGSAFGGGNSGGSAFGGGNSGGSTFGEGGGGNSGGSTFGGGGGSMFGGGSSGGGSSFGGPAASPDGSGGFSSFASGGGGASFGALANQTGSTDGKPPNTFGGQSFTSWR